MSDSEFVTITTTYNDPAWIEKFAQEIVGDRLAACVNILPMGQSVYRWEDNVETEPEGVALIHTTRQAAAALIQRLTQRHPYDEPQVLETATVAPTPGYAAWMTATVTELPHDDQ